MLELLMLGLGSTSRESVFVVDLIPVSNGVEVFSPCRGFQLNKHLYFHSDTNCFASHEIDLWFANNNGAARYFATKAGPKLILD